MDAPPPLAARVLSCCWIKQALSLDAWIEF
jgi:hypothetical protein